MARATLLAVLVLLSSMATGFYSVSSTGFSKVFLGFKERMEGDRQMYVVRVGET
ncbi:hypothetical protein FH972_006496 [Carpinus fangiana]|jgi:hypothetical protein|uniref:Uncharacterized protein n=1 Tax=Carpinus fangiana TaxID=176857 RepID=A0A5N6QVY7_9ROSI|nr:hypothetical protein FH972_006496 [Carpinus fangiana]